MTTNSYGLDVNSLGSVKPLDAITLAELERIRIAYESSKVLALENEIKELKKQMILMTDKYKEAIEHYKKDSVAFTVSKIQAKYGKEKFIMIKPDDLIKFIEDR